MSHRTNPVCKRSVPTLTTLVTITAVAFAAIAQFCSFNDTLNAADEPAAAERETQTLIPLAVPQQKRGWGPEQMTGPPDTLLAGDFQTAWASQDPDAQREWLVLEYAEPIQPKAVVIHATYNPGAVDKVGLFDPEEKEVVAWSGTDPTPRTAAKGISVIPVKVKFKTKRIKIYLDSPAVPGWNEIDAVGLRDADGKTHWAIKATASSTYAQPVVMQARQMVVISARDLQRLTLLETEVKALRKEVEKIKKLKTELEELKKLLREQNKLKKD